MIRAVHLMHLKTIKYAFIYTLKTGNVHFKICSKRKKNPPNQKMSCISLAIKSVFFKKHLFWKYSRHRL